MDGVTFCQLPTKDVARLAGVPFTTLHYWVKTRLLTCEVPARGTGTARRWGFLDVVAARMVARLRRDNVSLQTIRKAVRIMVEEWRLADPLRCGRLLAVDGQVYYDPTEDDLWDVLSRQRAIRRCVVLDIGELARETAEHVEALVSA